MVYSSRLACIGFTDSHLSITLDNTGSHITGTGRIHITLTTTIDVTEFSTALTCSTDSTTRYGHGSILGHSTHLTTAIDAALDGTSRDIHCGLLCSSKLIPLCVRSAVLFNDTTHAAAEHVTTIFSIYHIITNGTAIDIDSDLSTSIIKECGCIISARVCVGAVVLVILTHNTITILSSQVQTIAY